MIARVKLWGRVIGAVALETPSTSATFQYDPAFAQSGIEIAPLTMPLSERVYSFPELPPTTFHSLPGLLADTLPDRFGNALIDAWLARQGRLAASFGPVERLCYTGSRGMGALEFVPAQGPRPVKGSEIDIDALVQLASDVLSHRTDLNASLAEASREKAMSEILRVGTSAGGARAKAVIAWNRSTNVVRSGQIIAGDGFEYWLMKFDGVSGNKDKELADSTVYGAIEYAYHLMATAAGISMSECHLLEENQRRHFMTKRFDRLSDGGKLHMQSLCAMAHYDFNQPGAYSYEQALQVIRRLNLPMRDLEQLYRRMVFNIVARNQDDHVKNIAFLMDKTGQWSLSPAYDVNYSYNPKGGFTGSHQMTMNGKRDDFSIRDFQACARVAGLKRGRAEAMIDEVATVVGNWRTFAEKARVSPLKINKIMDVLRLNFPKT